jgi:hypothetical protein
MTSRQAETIRKIRAALDAFERDGKVLFRRYKVDAFREASDPIWDFVNLEYKPVPKPEELWVNEYLDYAVLFRTLVDAQKEANESSYPRIRTAVHYREVIEEPKT